MEQRRIAIRMEKIVPIHKETNKMDYSNYRGFSLLSTSFKILSKIHLSRIQMKLQESINEGLGGIDLLLTTCLAFEKQL